MCAVYAPLVCVPPIAGRAGVASILTAVRQDTGRPRHPDLEQTPIIVLSNRCFEFQIVRCRLICDRRCMDDERESLHRDYIGMSHNQEAST